MRINEFLLPMKLFQKFHITDYPKVKQSNMNA